MKIPKHFWVIGIILFYLMVKLVILLCNRKQNDQSNPIYFIKNNCIIIKKKSPCP
jgi:hypothetical protein